MLNIRITGVSGDGRGLILDNNGHSITHGPEDIQWLVATNKVRSIEAITWKSISGSTNVFLPGYPRERNPQKRVWFAQVNKYDSEYVYVYTITWVKDADGTTHDFDPIISIKPTPYIPKILASIVGVIGLAYFIYWRKKRMNENKK